MAFLIDNNLPPKVAEVMAARFPGTVHVASLRMDTLSNMSLAYD